MALVIAGSTRVVQGCGPSGDFVYERLEVDACVGTEPLEPVGSTSAALFAVQSCQDLPSYMRSALIERARQQVMAERCAILSQDCSEPEGSGFGCGQYMEDEVAAAYGAPAAPGDQAEEYSTTNTQESGVDEADFIKNDGQYIYVLSGGRLDILTAWPAADLAVVSSTPIEGRPQALYVYADRAVVYSYDPSRSCYDSYNYDSWYGYGCLPGDTTTIVSVLDLTDPLEPVLERRIELEGAYVSSRRIDGAVYTVVAFAGPEVEGVSTRPRTYACDYEDVEDLDADIEALIAQNTAIIAAAPIDVEPPSITDTIYLPDGTSETRSGLFDGCSNILVPEKLSGTSFLTALAFDIGDASGARASSVLGTQGVVYASPSSLYVASVENAGSGSGWESTTVHRFSLEAGPARATYQASGRVAGRVLNQFSMGEHEGDLRIATTSGHVPDPSANNGVYVLRQSGGDLATVGEVWPIAPSEDIRAARFVGDRGFVVTFKKTDPLFVIDLADPTAPRVAGELQIPGFSTYIHMLGDSQLLTIGYDAQDEGEFAWFQGIQLQLFDVANPSAPALLHKHVIGTRGTSSAAATNHLAFNYYPPLEMLAIPMAVCEDSAGGGSYGTVMSFNGLMLFDVDAASGFAEVGRIAHDLVAGDSGCSHWWTEPTLGVQRSIFMESFVYSISHEEIIVAELGDPSAEVASVPLAGTPDGT